VINNYIKRKSAKKTSEPTKQYSARLQRTGLLILILLLVYIQYLNNI
jgi:hypothetical protein